MRCPLRRAAEVQAGGPLRRNLLVAASGALRPPAMRWSEMDRDYPASLAMSFLNALVTALINAAVTGQVAWHWPAIAFALSFIFLLGYQGVVSLAFRPFKRWRIAEGELISLRATKKGLVWEFDRDSKEGDGFHGPYMPLFRGKYRVSFRLRIDERSEQDQPVCELDVTADDGRKWLAQRTISIRDFTRAEKWQDFPLDFILSRDENRVEFRLRMKDALMAQRRISFQSVALRRRLS